MDSDCVCGRCLMYCLKLNRFIVVCCHMFVRLVGMRYVVLQVLWLWHFDWLVVVCLSCWWSHLLFVYVLRMSQYYWVWSMSGAGDSVGQVT